MNRSIHPYYLLGFAAIAFAMLFLFKINKVSFYHHYFRVIEEVEIRNSQAMTPPALVLFSVTPKRAVIQPLLWLFAGVMGSLFFFSILLQQGTYPTVPEVRRDMRSFRLLPLVRAP
jgi:hypothetical protein